MMAEEKKEDYYSLADIVGTLTSFFKYLQKKWWLLLLTICIGAVLGVVYYYTQKPKFVAETTFILEEKSSSGSLAGLASQFGFSLGNFGGGSFFAGDNILDILKSKKVVRQVLLSKIESEDSLSNTLADLYLDFTHSRINWQKRPELAGINFRVTSASLTPIQDSVLNTIYERIVKKDLLTERLTKQGTIIRVQFTSANALFARLMTERLIEEASNLYLNIKTGTARDNIDKLQRRSDSLLYVLNRKSFTAAASQPLDINPGIKTAVVPLEIASRDKTVLATLYAEVIKNLEASKLLLSQQTPVIQLLDKPGILLDDNKKSIAFLIVIFASSAAIVYTLIAFFVFWFLRSKVF